MTMQALFSMLDGQEKADGSAFGAYDSELQLEIQAEALEKDFDRESGVNMVAEIPEVQIPEVPASDGVMEAKEAASLSVADEAALIASFQLPDTTSYRSRGERHELIFQGVATRCAHCSLKLTDAVSLERAMGPTCSKRGYLEDPKVSDEMGALIALAEFPALVEYVTQVYKPLGVRKMMNFLVRMCSLNRRSPVHAACTDAIEMLGYTQLASTLRESIAVVEVFPSKTEANANVIWVRKNEWHWGWTNALRGIKGAHFSKSEKGTVVPVAQKAEAWNLIRKYYAGFYCKTATGVVKIPALKVAVPTVPTP